MHANLKYRIKKIYVVGIGQACQNWWSACEKWPPQCGMDHYTHEQTRFQHCSKVRDLLLVNYKEFEPSQTRHKSMLVHLQYYTIILYLTQTLSNPRLPNKNV